MSGKFKSYEGNTITLEDGTKCEVAPNAKITRDGNDCELGDLEVGDQLSLSGKPATSVTATCKK